MNFSRLFLYIFSFIFIAGCSKQENIVSENKRIIALSPSLTETVFFLGAGENLSGVSSFCNFPEKAKNIPVVANVSDINIEYTLKLNPDIVLLMPSQDNIAEKLALLNIRTAVIRQESLDDILNSFVAVGKVTGTDKRAAVVHDSLKIVLDSYRGPANNKKVLISVGREYGTVIPYIYSNGRTGFLNDIISLLGYTNALETTVPYPKIGTETIMALDPDIIIDLAPENITLSSEELLIDWKITENTRAFKNGNIYIIKGDHTTIPGPRIFDFIKELKEKGL